MTMIQAFFSFFLFFTNVQSLSWVELYLRSHTSVKGLDTDDVDGDNDDDDDLEEEEEQQ